MNTNSTYLDAMDDLARARDMIELIGMTCCTMPTEEQKAISTGAHVAMNFLELARAGLKECAATFTTREANQ